MAVFGWAVLALVFLDEVLAVVAFAIWGRTGPAGAPGWLLVWLVPLVAVAAWWAFASPKAPYGGRGVRPVVKVLVFGLATLALWDAGHAQWAAALLVFSVVVNALAELPGVRSLAEEVAQQPPRVGG